LPIQHAVEQRVSNWVLHSLQFFPPLLVGHSACVG
jgi:hypothetical protein